MIGIANFARASKPIALAVLLQLGETYLCDAAPTDLSASQTIVLALTHSSPFSPDPKAVALRHHRSLHALSKINREITGLEIYKAGFLRDVRVAEQIIQLMIEQIICGAENACPGTGQRWSHLYASPSACNPGVQEVN
jgi:hypothetical protein